VRSLHWRLTGDSFPTAFEGRARSEEEAALSFTSKNPKITNDLRSERC
jgi:hypothetical protein